MKTLRSIFLLSILVVSTYAMAQMPPRYLSVPDWKSCVSTYPENGAELYCLGEHRPLACPKKSWRMLQRQSKLPDCPLA